MKTRHAHQIRIGVLRNAHDIRVIDATGRLPNYLETEYFFSDKGRLSYKAYNKARTKSIQKDLRHIERLRKELDRMMSVRKGGLK